MSIVGSVYYFEWFVVSVEFQVWHISFNKNIPGPNISKRFILDCLILRWVIVITYWGLILAGLTHLRFPVLRV